MWLGSVDVDGNGIVFFDPVVLRRWRPNMTPTHDLFRELVTTDAGDEVLAKGIIVPILAIDDGGYDVVVRRADEAQGIAGDLIVDNGVFPLVVESELVVADLSIFRSWADDLGWTRIPVPAGTYASRVRGIRQMSDHGQRMIGAGYELVLAATPSLPPVSGETGKNMRLFNWWDNHHKEGA
jgi:hypothetical protein